MPIEVEVGHIAGSQRILQDGIVLVVICQTSTQVAEHDTGISDSHLGCNFGNYLAMLIGCNPVGTISLLSIALTDSGVMEH